MIITVATTKSRGYPAVAISKGFWIGQTEVTEAAYARVMKNDPRDLEGFDRPVKRLTPADHQVTWKEADAYCRAIGMRLPTEAEWEYAARAGKTYEPYSGIFKNNVYTASSSLPNNWGLYMLGDDDEWTNDWYEKDYYKTSPKDDPPGPASGKYKVMRGYLRMHSPERGLIVVHRSTGAPTDRNYGQGFRCAGELRS